MKKAGQRRRLTAPATHKNSRAFMQSRTTGLFNISNVFHCLCCLKKYDFVKQFLEHKWQIKYALFYLKPLLNKPLSSEGISDTGGISVIGPWR